MTSTKVDLNAGQIARLQDAADLAELLFPGNRNQQHCFLVLWFSLKWAAGSLVPNLLLVAEEHGISKRTLERVRAKLRRLGLIDHVSRFNVRHGYREGWVLSTRFSHNLRVLADTSEHLARSDAGSPGKDRLLLDAARARRDIAVPTRGAPRAGTSPTGGRAQEFP